MFGKHSMFVPDLIICGQTGEYFWNVQTVLFRNANSG